MRLNPLNNIIYCILNVINKVYHGILISCNVSFSKYLFNIIVFIKSTFTLTVLKKQIQILRDLINVSDFSASHIIVVKLILPGNAKCISSV